MKCPNCGKINSSVYGTKGGFDTFIQRYRICNSCGYRWCTEETHDREVVPRVPGIKRGKQQQLKLV